MRGEPILIPCEGSACPPARTTFDPRTLASGGYVGLCSMCGTFQSVLDGGCLARHQRDDVIARIYRGDFDEPTAQSDEAPACCEHTEKQHETLRGRRFCVLCRCGGPPYSDENRTPGQ